MSLRLAVVGDVHLRFDETDARLLDAGGYDAVLFVGDLAGYNQRGGRRVARDIAKITTPTFVLPGNHDGPNLLQLASEVFPALSPLRPVLGFRQQARTSALAEALGRARLVGYDLFSLGEATVLAGRPHSCGGPRLSFPRYLEDAFGVGSMDDSADKLCALVDEAPADRPIVVLSHNGPTGLGEEPNDMCGRDFHPDGGDWGDPDLEIALDHARAVGKRVVAVVAGHMHHALRGGGRRTWLLERHGVLYVNAARVPRIFREAGVKKRHHVALTLERDHARAEPRLLTDEGSRDEGMHAPPPA